MHLEGRSQPLEDRPLPEGVQLVHWKGGSGRFTYSRFLEYRADFARLVNTLRPDVILAGPLQTCAFLAASLNLPNLIAMSWGYDLLIDAARSRWSQWITRYTLQRSAAFLGDCETIRNLAVAYGMNPERIVTFPWGVDLEYFSPASRVPGSTAQIMFLSTRSWEPIYGVELIARAFAQVARRHPHVSLLMLGNGSLAGELRRFLDSQDLTARVTFPGQIGYRNLPEYYRLADIYVSASHSDGTSISMLEAMACGRPVIVSDIPGNREWITPGVEGWLFPDGDANALACAMEEALSQPQRLLEMSAAARQLVEQRANWKENFPKIYQAFAWVSPQTSAGGVR